MLIFLAFVASLAFTFGLGLAMGWWMRGETLYDNAYDEGYQRGHDDGFQEALHAVGWLQGDNS